MGGQFNFPLCVRRVLAGGFAGDGVGFWPWVWGDRILPWCGGVIWKFRLVLSQSFMNLVHWISFKNIYRSLNQNREYLSFESSFESSFTTQKKKIVIRKILQIWQVHFIGFLIVFFYVLIFSQLLLIFFRNWQSLQHLRYSRFNAKLTDKYRSIFKFIVHWISFKFERDSVNEIH